MELHDHCVSCYSRKCKFDVVEDVCCEVTVCPEQCGQIFHRCKLEDHLILCCNTVVSCINRCYGCPVMLQRCRMSLHLKICPANIIICTMEWNRRDCGSLISQQNFKTEIQKMKDTSTVDHNLDIACAVHDQAILLETIIPSKVLKYYSNLADREFDELKKSTYSANEPEKTVKPIIDEGKITKKSVKICYESDETNSKGTTQDSSLNEDNQKILDTKVEPTSMPETNSDKSEKKRKPGLLSKLRGQSSLFAYTSVGSSANISSLGWLPRKEYRHIGTDTASLPVNKSTLEWLSPEVSLRSLDLISRIFSIIGSDSRSPSSEGSVSHYMLESSVQTVPPFLIHVDMGRIGRQLSNFLLTLSSTALQERRRIRSLLTKGQESLESFEDFNISKNLKFHSLALNSCTDFFSRSSVLKRRSWFTSLASFMCGCILRRDQFSSHVENVHCDIMAGLNGWLEEKCPYSAYGCRYTAPRYSPGDSSKNVVYHHNLGSFAVSQTHSFQNSPSVGDIQDCFVLRLPYDALTHLFQYLDPFALYQISLTCKYLRDICKNILVSRGVVEMRWRKQENASPQWMCDETIWYFPLAFEKVQWVPSGRPLMAVHLEKCDVKENEDRSVIGGSSIFLPMNSITSKPHSVEMH